MDELCGDYQRGRCLRGASCRYRHVGDIPQRAPGDINDEERDMTCRDYLRGRCVRENCRFKHIGEIEQQAPPPSGILDDSGRILNLPPRGVFAPPPQQAVDLSVQEKEEEGPSSVPSEVLGVSELDICKMSPEELIIHIERRIRIRQADERHHDHRGPGEGFEATAEDDAPPLPPLPAPQVPSFVQGIPTQEVYQVITELAGAIDREGEHKVAEVVHEDINKDIALAIFQVLHQSGQLRAPNGELQPVPVCPAPALPPGHKSWVLLETAEEKAARLRREREEQHEKELRKRKRQEDFRKWEKEQRAKRRKEERVRQQLVRARRRLEADRSIPADMREALGHELQELGPGEIEDLLRFGEAELQELDESVQQRLTIMQRLLRNTTGDME